MTINTDFPFEYCESCDECILRVCTDSVIYGNDKIVQRVITVFCENARLCKRLEKQINEQKTSSNPID